MKDGRETYNFRIRAALAILIGGVLMAPAGIYGQELRRLSFEEASIHEWGPGQGPAGEFAAGVQFSPGRIRAQCASLQSLLFYAYQLNGSERLEGVPQWGNATCGYPDSAGTFAIEATMPASATNAESRQMLQTLLAERFKLVARWENRQLPVYALALAPGKSKLKPSDPGKDPPVPRGAIACPADDPHCHIGFCCGCTSLTLLAGGLSRIVGRPVIDKTGLAGDFYLGVLRWAGDEGAGSSLPSLPALLRDQFGLELKPETGPVPVLIIEHVEKPLAN